MNPTRLGRCAFQALFSLLACALLLPAARAQNDWATTFDLGRACELPAVTTDAAGNTYAAGYFNLNGVTTTLTIGSVTLTRIGGQDALVVKYSPTGTVLWAKNFGGSGAATTATGIAVDSAGNVYVAGYFSAASLTTPALTKIGTQDAFALKLDSTGVTLWAKNFGGSGATTNGNGIAVDSAGDVYLGGNFSGASLTTPALTKIGTQDAFALKLDPTGATTWAKNFGGSGATTAGSSIVVDGSGNVCLGGNFSGASLTTPTLTEIGTQDAFALKLDSTGATTWAKNFGGSGATTNGTGVAVDGSGNVYFSGFYNAALTTPALPLISSPETDAFALKLDSTGALTWAKNFGGTGSTVARCIAVDGSGNVYLGGSFSATNLTSPALARIGSADALALRLDSTGALTWSRNFGGSFTPLPIATVAGIAVDGSGNVCLSGHFLTGNLTTPPLTLVSCNVYNFG